MTVEVSRVDVDGYPQPWRISDLIDLLQTFPPDGFVILSSDAEGNSFKPLLEATEKGPCVVKIEHGYADVKFVASGTPSITLVPYD